MRAKLNVKTVTQTEDFATNELLHVDTTSAADPSGLLDRPGRQLIYKYRCKRHDVNVIILQS